jgi:predicted ATPase
MREVAETFLADVQQRPDSPQAGVAHRLMGTTGWYSGDYLGARPHLDRALAISDHDRDLKLSASFAYDQGVAAKFYLGMSLWALGETDRGAGLLEDALSLALRGGHIPTIALARHYMIVFATVRRKLNLATAHAQALLDLDLKHGLPNWRGFAQFQLAWAAQGGDPNAVSTMRRALALQRETDFLVEQPLFGTLLAETEAERGDLHAAMETIDGQIALIARTGERWYEAEATRVRGEILLKFDPANSGPAEHAFQTAIAVAKQQGTRSFELRAALSVAKLYQATGRPVDAHAALAPALEGFAPTPEMPEIAEAQALLAALAETDEVKAAFAQRDRRLHLQTAYGQALMYSRGYASDESKIAFARARTLAAGVGDASERFDAYYGLFVGSLLGGELGLARETAESFLREAETERRMTEAAVARRSVGLARLWQGDLIGAEANLAVALRIYDPERDRDAKFRFTADNGVAAAAYLALASWALGNVERARALSDEALACADETPHAPTHASVYHFISLYHVLRGDPETVRRTAKIPVDLGREHGMALWLAFGEVHSNWARAWLGDRESGMKDFREALVAYNDQGNKMNVPLFQGLIAELEAEGDDADGALRRIDEALALANETGERWTDALLHRIRGEILLKRDPANPSPAEEAYRTAIAVAQTQKARSFELRAALALAKLYQSTGRPVEAHAILAPALEGFAPTPEMPEIAEAQTLLAALV